MTTGVYGIQNIVTIEWYIGQAVDTKRCLNRHFSLLRKDKHSNKHLQSSFNKYGEAAFDKHELEKCLAKDLTSTEQKWINLKDSYHNGFNKTPAAGSTIGYKHSDETKANVSSGMRTMHSKYSSDKRIQRGANISSGQKEKLAKRTNEQKSLHKLSSSIAQLNRPQAEIEKHQYNQAMSRFHGGEKWHLMCIDKLRSDLNLHGLTTKLEKEHKRLVKKYKFYQTPSGSERGRSLAPVASIKELLNTA